MRNAQFKQFSDIMKNLMTKHADDLSQFYLTAKVFTVTGSDGEKVEHIMPVMYAKWMD